MGMLTALCPKADIEPETMLVYLDALSDIPDEALAEAFRTVSRTWKNAYALPMPAHIREVVIDQRLRLPSNVEAWEQAYAFCYREREWVECDYEGCDNGLVALPDHAVHDAVMRCPVCKGGGRYEINMPETHPLVRRAMDAVGGSLVIRSSDHPARMRADFLKAYAQLREQTEQEAMSQMPSTLQLPAGVAA